MKILAFVPYEDTSKYPKPYISSCVLDTETGETSFDTSRIEFRKNEMGLYEPKGNSQLCEELHNRIENESPDEIVSYFELGRWRTQKDSIYPPKTDGNAILKQKIDSTSLFRFVGSDNTHVFTFENIAEVWNYEDVQRTFNNFASHLRDETVWERFCFSLCATYLQIKKHKDELAEVRDKERRSQQQQEEAAAAERQKLEAAAAAEKRERTLEKIQEIVTVKFED